MEQRVEIIERIAVQCAHCLDAHFVSLTVEEDGEEFEIIVPCRKCGEES
jgi:hypothetical protein